MANSYIRAYIEALKRFPTILCYLFTQQVLWIVQSVLKHLFSRPYKNPYRFAFLSPNRYLYKADRLYSYYKFYPSPQIISEI